MSLNRRFNKDGVFVGLSDTYTFNEDWYGSIAVGFEDGAFYLPRYRVDATLYRKWLPQKNLVTSIGAGQYKAPDGHTDNSLSLGLVYYFDTPFVAEVGLRLNSSHSGAIKTPTTIFSTHLRTHQRKPGDTASYRESGRLSDHWRNHTNGQLCQ